MVDPPEVISINAGICTVFAAITFYITYLYTAPIAIKQGRLFRFLIFTIVLILVFSSLRSLLIYSNFEFALPGNSYWESFRSFTTSAFHILYVTTVATVIRLLIEQYQAQQHIANLEKEKVSTELLYLRNQINPHFFFNVHNSIYFLIKENPSLAATVVLKLSDIMRYQIYDCQQEWVSLTQELNNLESYIELEKVRTGERVKVVYENRIKSGARLLAPFMLITFVENSFKHISTNQPKNRIEIIVAQKDEWLDFTIRNTVDTFISINQNSGLGLQNLQKRLALLYKDKHEITIERNEFWYTVQLKLILR